MRKLSPQPLSARAFAPFGETLQDSSAPRTKHINDNTTLRFDDIATVQTEGGRPAISIFRAIPRPRPIRIAMLECHPLGSQAFMPADHRKWLIVVAPGKEQPDWQNLQCFHAENGQGVNYHPGVWHHPLLVLHPNQNFWVADRIGPANESPDANLREVPCPEEWISHIEIESN